MIRLTLPTLAILAYVVPAILSVTIAPYMGYDFSDEGRLVVLMSVVATIAGFALGTRLPASIGPIKDEQVPVGTLKTLAYILMACGSAAMILNFFSVGSIPLVNKGAGRIGMLGSPLWNIFVLCGLGVFFFAHTMRRTGKIDVVGAVMFSAYLLLAFASAWKGTVIFTAIIFATPLLQGRRIHFVLLLLAGLAFVAFFLTVNGLREGNTLYALIRQPLYYAVWGFVNFDDVAVGHLSDCIHSIPGFGCQFGPSNDILINRAYNVYTALAPLHIDGGLALVILVFGAIAFAITVLNRMPPGLISSYALFAGTYFFAMAHNGYSFYSKTFLAGIIIVTVVTIVAKLSLRGLPGRPLVK